MLNGFQQKLLGENFLTQHSLTFFEAFHRQQKITLLLCMWFCCCCLGFFFFFFPLKSHWFSLRVAQSRGWGIAKKRWPPVHDHSFSVPEKAWDWPFLPWLLLEFDPPSSEYTRAVLQGALSLKSWRINSFLLLWSSGSLTYVPYSP